MDLSSLDTELVSEMFSAMAKEVKSTRTKAKEVENQAQIMLQRAEAAEHALGVMTRNFEETSREKQRLSRCLDELQDSKTRVKQESTESLSGTKMSCDKSSWTETDDANPDLDYVRRLEEALEMYYMKYKNIKHVKSGMRDEIKDLNGKLSELGSKRQELETKVQLKDKDIKDLEGKFLELHQGQMELRSSLEKRKQTENENARSLGQTSTSNIARMLYTYKDINEFVSRLPTPNDHFRQEELGPVCLTTVDLIEFISTDPRLTDMAANLLCLPAGRTLWCSPEKIHAIALGPMYTCRIAGDWDSWIKDSTFRNLYGRVLHFFYTKRDGFVYYAGLFKIVNLRAKFPEGISLEGIKDDYWTSLAEASTRDTKLALSNTIISKLYRAGALWAEPLGLQSVSFNMDTYHILQNRFTMVQLAMKSVGKWGGYYPETESIEGGERTHKRRKTISQAGV